MHYFDSTLGKFFSAGYLIAPAIAAVLYTSVLLMILALIGTGVWTLLH